MINVIHVDIHCNDQRKISAMEIKLKSFTNDKDVVLSKHILAATVSAAFFKTTLLTDVGKTLRTSPNSKRQNIIDLTIDFQENNLTFDDIAHFLKAFQDALDDTRLF